MVAPVGEHALRMRATAVRSFKIVRGVNMAGPASFPLAHLVGHLSRLYIDERRREKRAMNDMGRFVHLGQRHGRTKDSAGERRETVKRVSAYLSRILLVAWLSVTVAQALHAGRH